MTIQTCYVKHTISDGLILHKIKVKIQAHFCASPYFTHSYVFISWTGKMAEAFVLAHELGHAGHFTLAQKHQPYLESEASMYFVEALLQ